MSDFNSIWVQIVTLKLGLISDPVSGDFAQIVSGLRRRKKSEKWHPFVCHFPGFILKIEVGQSASTVGIWLFDREKAL